MTDIKVLIEMLTHCREEFLCERRKDEADFTYYDDMYKLMGEHIAEIERNVDG